MSRHTARKQKSLAKKKAKRKERHQLLARRTSNDPTLRLADAARWPITACLVPDSLWQEGIGNLIIARRNSRGEVAMAVFCLDVFCLGVKNITWKVDSPELLRTIIDDIHSRTPLSTVTPEYFSKLVHQAVDYAQSLGIAPHPSFRNLRRLLDGIDPSLCNETFSFGKDGKPFFVNGPFDSPERVSFIVNLMREHGGDYTVLVKSSSEVSELIRTYELVAEEIDDEDDFDDEDEDDDDNVIEGTIC